jgi:phosphoketolase
MNAYWRAANYLTVGQIYLQDNPLLEAPLTLEHINIGRPWSVTNSTSVNTASICRKYSTGAGPSTVVRGRSHRQPITRTR